MPCPGPALHCGETLTVYRDGLAGGMQLHSGRGLRGILHYTNVAWWGAGGQARWGSPSPCSSPGLHMVLKITFVGPLGDAHSLADELIVSPPPAPAHATAAATRTTKATTLT